MCVEDFNRGLVERNAPHLVYFGVLDDRLAVVPNQVRRMVSIPVTR
jgi:hypothetical protein